MLLNFTKKRWMKDFLGSKLRHELMFDPFCRVVSRINYKPDLFLHDLCAEYIPDLLKAKLRSLSWEECCLERAAALLKMNRDRYLISWSGGIDSTTMMISLVRSWPKEALRKVTVFLSHSSVFENPLFFDKVITKFPLRTSMREVSLELQQQDVLLVTGELGDQLFGSDILGPAVARHGDAILRKPYADWAPEVIDLWNRREGSGKPIFERFHPMVSEAPFPIRSVFDFFWWMNFSQKWQHVKYRYVEQAGWDLNARYGKHIIHFFDTLEFQKWSLDNHDLKLGADWSSYKLEAKKFIVNFTKNKGDLTQKKIPSLALRNFLIRKRIAVTSDLREIKTDEELEKYVRA